MRGKSNGLDARAFGLAAATIAAALTSICAFAVAVAPAATTAVASTLIHMDLSSMSRSMSWGVFFSSLIGWTIGAGLIFWAAGALYNRYPGATTARAPTESAFAARTS